ncbi:Rdx family protein [Schnuerera ultunensis]|nr:Rdx family protein [Schnuerera ultunensis]
MSELKIIPSSDGVFEITIGDELIFSKKELGRFPEENEVEEMVKNKI